MDAVSIFEDGRKAENESLAELASLMAPKAGSSMASKVMKGVGKFAKSSGIVGMILHMAQITIIDMAMNHLISKINQSQNPENAPRQLSENEINSILADYVRRLPEDQKAVVVGNKGKLVKEVSAEVRKKISQRGSQHSGKHGRKTEAKESDTEKAMNEAKTELDRARQLAMKYADSPPSAERKTALARMSKAEKAYEKSIEDHNLWVSKKTTNPKRAATARSLKPKEDPSNPGQPKGVSAWREPASEKTNEHELHEPKSNVFKFGSGANKKTKKDDKFEDFKSAFGIHHDDAIHHDKNSHAGTYHYTAPTKEVKKPGGLTLGGNTYRLTPLGKKTAIGAAITVGAAALIFAAHKFITWLKDRGEKPSQMSDDQLKRYIDENLEDYHLPSVVVRARTDDKFRKKLVEDTLKAVRETDKTANKSLVLASKGILKHPDEKGPYSPVEHKGFLGKAGDAIKNQAEHLKEWTKKSLGSSASEVGEFSRRAVVGFGKAAVAVAVSHVADQVAEKIFKGEGTFSKLGKDVLTKGAAITSLGGIGLSSMRNNDPMIQLELEKHFMNYITSLENSSDPQKEKEGIGLRTLWLEAGTNDEIRRALYSNLLKKIEAHNNGANYSRKDWLKRS